MEKEEGEETKANLFHRFVARFVDFLVVAAFYELPLRVGFWIGLTYLLLADGLTGGRSLGKLLIGLSTSVPDRNQFCSVRESVLRNFPFAIAYLLYAMIPYVGWILAMGLIVIEGLLVIGNDKGQRIGDEIAKTVVLEGLPRERVEK